jgi:hypothetical protein
MILESTRIKINSLDKVNATLAPLPTNIFIIQL